MCPKEQQTSDNLVVKETGIRTMAPVENTGKNLWFTIYVYNMVFGRFFNVFDETRKRNNFQFWDP